MNHAVHVSMTRRVGSDAAEKAGEENKRSKLHLDASICRRTVLRKGSMRSLIVDRRSVAELDEDRINDG